MKLSIIVPIYNAEAYLCRCLDSLIDIQCPEMEMICIDDGSTDSSWEICERYAEKDVRIKAFRQGNAGPMAARNKGLREAAGEYVCFVDSDDWIDPEMPTYLIRKMDEDPSIDVSVSAVVRNYSDGSEKKIFKYIPERMFIGEEAEKEMVRNRIFSWYMCGKIYRKNVFRGFHADESILISEDLDSNWRLFQDKRIRTVWYSPKYKYHYFVNPASMTEGSEMLKKRSSDLKVYNKILNAQSGMEQEISIIMKIYALCAVYDILRELCFRGADDEELMKYIVEGRKLVFGLDRCDKEDIWFVDKMRRLTESIEQTKGYFLDVFQAVRKTLSSLTSVEKGMPLYIYGAGIAAGYAAAIMDNENFMEYEGHVISDGQPSMGWFRGKPVFHFSQIPKDSVLVLALNQSNQNAVCRNLEGDWHVVSLPIPDKF